MTDSMMSQGCLTALYLLNIIYNSLIPRLLPVFFNDAHRKTREPGKLHNMCDVRWRRLGAAHTPFKILARERSLVNLMFLAILAGLKMSIPGDSSLLSCLYIALLPVTGRCTCMCCAQVPSTWPHARNEFYQAPSFVCIHHWKNWEEPGYKAISTLVRIT